MTGSGNPIWNYFRRNEGTATCIVCMKELSLGSILPKNQTVSSIKKHLEKVHPHEYTAFRKLEEEYVLQKSQNVNVKRRAKRKRLKELKEAIDGPRERKKPGRKRKVDKYSESEDMDNSSMTNIEIILHDPLVMNEEETPIDITEAKNENVDLPHTLHEQKRLIIRPGDVALSRRIDRSILDLMIVDMLPFSVVEGEAFKRLNLGDPSRPSKYIPKAADYYKNNMVPETYEAVKRKVNACLEQAEWISLSTSTWTHPSKSCCLQSVTGHFLQENQKHVVVLQIYPKALAASSLNFIDLTRKFNIVDKIHVNVVKEIDNKSSSEWFNCLECSAELMERVIADSVLSGESIEILNIKCHSIVDHFVNNPQAAVNLNECQEICGLPHQKLFAGTDENWTSTFLMWDRLCENKVALEMYIQQYGGLQVPSAHEWQKMEHSVILLRIFHQAWLDVNSEAACASVIIPLLTMINAKLEPKLTDTQELAYLKQSVKSLLNEKFAYVHQSSFLIIATLLDPRFKMKYLTNNQLSSCHAEMTHNLRISLNLEGEDCMTPSFNTLPTNNYKFHNTSDLWEEHDTSTLSENNTNESVFLAFEQQLSFYLKEPLIARNGNIYQYWNITPYEYLRKLAYKYLSAPPTTMACNDTISNVSSLYAERRLMAKNEGVEDDKLLFMACNIKLFNFEY